MKKEEENWISARNSDAASTYGPQWRTFALQDRGLWDEENRKFFPKTVSLLSNLRTPSCEVFFARQAPHSGIAPHSDLNNFILTCHLALQVEPDKAWIRVGDDVKYWEENKAMAFDTSIFHSTRNDADTDRYVLLIRSWHPDLSAVEINGLTFIFDFLNFMAIGDYELNKFEYEYLNNINSNNNVVNKKIDYNNNINRKDTRGPKGFHRGH